MHQGFHFHLGAESRHGLGAFLVNGIEFLPSGLGENADQIDHGVGPQNCRPHGIFIPQIGLNHLYLTNFAQRFDMHRRVGSTHRHPNPNPGFRQMFHQCGAHKSPAAKNSHQLLCHDILQKHRND